METNDSVFLLCVEALLREERSDLNDAIAERIGAKAESLANAIVRGKLTAEIIPPANPQVRR